MVQCKLSLISVRRLCWNLKILYVDCTSIQETQKLVYLLLAYYRSFIKFTCKLRIKKVSSKWVMIICSKFVCSKNLLDMIFHFKKTFLFYFIYRPNYAAYDWSNHKFLNLHFKFVSKYVILYIVLVCILTWIIRVTIKI
jgi:hypothetical protein